jgi:hypothetical protein
LTVYGYARVSTERQADEGVSLDEQIRRIEDARSNRAGISPRRSSSAGFPAPSRLAIDRKERDLSPRSAPATS